MSGPAGILRMVYRWAVDGGRWAVGGNPEMGTMMNPSARTASSTGAANSAELAREIESVEIEAWADLFRAAPADLRREKGIELLEDGGVLATRASRLDILAFNRVIGLGLRRPIPEARAG